MLCLSVRGHCSREPSAPIPSVTLHPQCFRPSLQRLVSKLAACFPCKRARADPFTERRHPRPNLGRRQPGKLADPPSALSSLPQPLSGHPRVSLWAC